MRNIASRVLAVTVAAICIVPAIVVGTGAAAEAATPHCSDSRNQVMNSANDVFWLPSTSGGGSLNCILSNGGQIVDDGAVYVLQVTLDDCYGKSLAMDNDFGPQTESALKSVQRSLGVTADGVYGPVTGKKMKWSYHASNVGPTIGCKSAASYF